MTARSSVLDALRAAIRDGLMLDRFDAVRADLTDADLDGARLDGPGSTAVSERHATRTREELSEVDLGQV